MSMDFLLRPVDDHANSIVVLEPVPDFVVKSRLVTVDGRPSHLLKLENGSKVFINVCHHEKVPKPDIEFDAIVVYPLIMNNQWEIPIITSSVREDRDKKGALCYVWDCCINPVCTGWISEDLQLREILVEWCLESCEMSDVVGISRDHIAFPKMKKKGDSIPRLEVYASELMTDYRKEIAKMVEKEDSSPSKILELRRNLIDETSSVTESLEDDKLPPLMPVGKVSKPLIEEIDNLSIAGRKSTEAGIHKVLPEVQFEVRIKRIIKPSKFKLRIEIQSKINSASDLRLRYSAQDNALEICNTNTRIFQEKRLQIPLPNIFSEADIDQIEALFIKEDGKLAVFI